MLDKTNKKLIGRGTSINPPNRFEHTHVEADFEQLTEEEIVESSDRIPTEYLPDATKSIVTENKSPDIGFRYSLNPYRGCSHGCSYCYARPTHEYLGFSAGTDFESKVLVKHEAAKLLQAFLSRPQWQPEQIMLSGVTDPYQPAEREFRVTRACLEVALAARQPLSIITKNARILRDLDLISAMARLEIVQVAISVTTLDAELARTMEPRTSTPQARLRAIRELSAAGVPVLVMTAPIVPGLNDVEIPSILAAAAEAGARRAAYVMLRLPHAVKPIFLDWLDTNRPDSRQRVESAIRGTRDGALYSNKFGERMKGTGVIAEQIGQMFKKFAKHYGLDKPMSPLRCDLFQPPEEPNGQKRLF